MNKWIELVLESKVLLLEASGQFKEWFVRVEKLANERLVYNNKENSWLSGDDLLSVLEYKRGSVPGEFTRVLVFSGRKYLHDLLACSLNPWALKGAVNFYRQAVMSLVARRRAKGAIVVVERNGRVIVCAPENALLDIASEALEVCEFDKNYAAALANTLRPAEPLGVRTRKS